MKLSISIVLLFLILLSLSVDNSSGEEIHKSSNGNFIHEIKLGILMHDPDHLWSQQRKEDGVDLNAELIFSRPSLEMLKGTIRPNLGVSINTEGDTSKIYAGLLWQHIFKNNIFLNLGLGGALHNGELETDDKHKKELGSRVLFRIPIEIGFLIKKHHAISLAFDHVSNAWLADENEGLDTIGIRYGYIF